MICFLFEKSFGIWHSKSIFVRANVLRQILSRVLKKKIPVTLPFKTILCRLLPEKKPSAFYLLLMLLFRSEAIDARLTTEKIVSIEIKVTMMITLPKP